MPEVDTVAVQAHAAPRQPSSLDASLSSDAGSAGSSFMMANAVPNAHIVRLESRWDSAFDGGSQWRLGDAVSPAGAWGTALRFAGIQVGTLPPADSPLEERTAIAGVAALPSMLDILLSGARRTDGLTAAPDVRLVGPNTLSFTLQDAMGSRQVVARPLFAPTPLAAPGCAESSGGLGRVRKDYAMQSNAYGGVFANAMVRCGLPSGLSVEGHGEYLEGQRALGVNLAQGLPGIGIASAAIATSNGAASSGWLAQMGLEHEQRAFNLTMRARLQSRGYRPLGMQAAEAFAWRAATSIDFRTSETGSVGIAYLSQSGFDRARDEVLALTHSLTVQSGGRLSLTAGRSLGQGEAASVSVFYSQPLGTLVRRVEPLRSQAQ